MHAEEQQFLKDLDKRLWAMASHKLLPMLDAAVYKQSCSALSSSNAYRICAASDWVVRGG
jgi:hypothetical protein